MREARLILPATDNAGHSLDLIHDALAQRLYEAFGGFTAIRTDGAWIDDSGRLIREPGTAYDIAMSEDGECADKLRSIAADVCGRAEQDCVYIRLASGNVEFVPVAIKTNV